MTENTALWILGGAFAIITGLIGLLYTDLRTKVENHEKRLAELETISALFQDFKVTISASLTKLEMKLDRVLEGLQGKH